MCVLKFLDPTQAARPRGLEENVSQTTPVRVFRDARFLNEDSAALNQPGQLRDFGAVYVCLGQMDFECDSCYWRNDI